MIADPITDMLNRIRNAQAVRHATVEVPHSKLKERIASIFIKEKLVEKVEMKKVKNQKVIRIHLKYQTGGDPFISGLKRISKPSQKIYKKAKDIKRVKDGYGLAIISTSKGLMTDNEARKNKMGGEVLYEVW